VRQHWCLTDRKPCCLLLQAKARPSSQVCSITPQSRDEPGARFDAGLCLIARCDHASWLGTLRTVVRLVYVVAIA